jgi:hypothetical protein
MLTIPQPVQKRAADCSSDAGAARLPAHRLSLPGLRRSARQVDPGARPGPGEIALLLMTAAYLGVILFLTSRRSQVTRSTLAIGTGTGLLFGVVMYAVAPLGLTNDATDPWLPGSTADPLVTLAWILLIGGPAAAAALAAWRGRGPGGTATSDSARALPPGCRRTGPPRCSSPRSAPARPR